MDYHASNVDHMKTILVPTDFSKPANNALNYAVELAKKENSKIVLLHVYHFAYLSPAVTTKLVNEQFRIAELEILKQLETTAFKISEKTKIKCEHLHVEGLVADTIVNLAKSKRVNKIVMGAKGAGSVLNTIMGSITADVIQHANCPVIAIPEGSKYKPVKRITYATDYLASDMTSLKKLLEMAKAHRAKITLLHVSEEQFSPELEKEFLKEFSAKIKKKFDPERMSYKLIFGKNVEKRLEEYIKSEPVDMLALSTLKRGPFDRLFGGSITKTFFYHTKIPLMVFHHKEKHIVFL